MSRRKRGGGVPQKLREKSEKGIGNGKISGRARGPLGME